MMMKVLNYLIIFAFPFVATAVGSLLVVFKGDKQSLFFSGFALGITFSASVFSLVMPALELCEKLNRFSFVPVVVGVLLGGGFINLINVLLKKRPKNNFFLAVTIHNVPEGLAVGFAFCFKREFLLSAVALSVAIGVQNLPEGLAVALNYKSKKRGVVMGVLSGAVEPISALIGALTGSWLLFLQPYALAFSAGVMIYAILEEMLKVKNVAVKFIWGFILGFCFMTGIESFFG